MVAQHSSHPNQVISAVRWLTLCLAVVAGALLLRGPSATVFDAVTARTLGIPGVDVVAEAGVVVLGLLVAVAAVQACRGGPEGLRRVVVALGGVVVAYGLSELVKLLVREERPCRGVTAITGCPAVGDFSFPSNHTVIAWAGAAAVLVLTRGVWPAWARAGVVVVAVVVAAGRVAQGVHYPHDVLAGAALGWCVVVLVVLLVPAGARDREAQPVALPR